MPKVSHETQKNHPTIIENRALTSPKIEAKRLLKGFHKQDRMKNPLGEYQDKCLIPFFRILRRLGSQDGFHFGGQDGFKIIKKSMQKKMKC